MGKPKHYIGNVNKVLYQHMCDLGNYDVYSIRCGNYAFSKIVNLPHIIETPPKSSTVNLNGEPVLVVHCPKLDKNQLILSAGLFGERDYIESEDCNDTTVYPNDIVLYFA